VTGSVRGEMSTATASGAPGVHVIRCGQCGRSIPIVQPVPSIVCPACHTSTSLESEWLSSVSVYAQQLRALETASWQAEVSDALARLSDPKSLAKWANNWGAMFVVLPISTLLLSAYRSQETGFHAILTMMAGVMGFFVLGISAHLVLRGATKVAPMRFARWRYRWGEGRRLASTWVPPAKRVQCPACGAKVELGAGMAVDACSHCGASLAVAIHKIWRASWELVANARRQATARQPPSRFFRTFDALAQRTYRPGVLHDPWHQLLELSSWLGGQTGMHNLRWWLNGFWPEALPQGFFHDLGNFACGSSRGYPVALGSRLWLVVFVGAVASPVDQRVNRDVSYYRTSAGYMLTALLPWSDATSSRLWWIVDQLVEQAQRDGAPPAPFFGAPPRPVAAAADPVWGQAGGVFGHDVAAPHREFDRPLRQASPPVRYNHEALGELFFLFVGVLSSAGLGGVLLVHRVGLYGLTNTNMLLIGGGVAFLIAMVGALAFTIRNIVRDTRSAPADSIAPRREGH
jgi:DNA-directed RNA polymerase subunit RPC12/RpoP